MDPFVDQLNRLCIAYPTRAKWVLVPTHAIGLTLGERIALEGTNWINLRFVTPLDIALGQDAVKNPGYPSTAALLRKLMETAQERGSLQ